MDAFLNDQSEGAYERAVDRLLNSPRFGEHMAVDWLEASRYADTDGYQNDRLRYMWVWRDWLINALNTNLPFDRFITEQMAGDLLPDRDFFTQVATGFNRNHRINSEGGSIPDEWIVEYVADRVETTGTIFLGLTLNCSRCHDHKYDPIAQKDFYRLFAFFNSIDEAGLGSNNGNSPPFIQVPKNWPNLTGSEREFVIPEPPKIKISQSAVPRPQSGKPDTAMVLHELAKPRATYRLRRGQYDQPDKSEELTPATPPVLGAWNKRWPNNRLGLARWLTAPDHPLTARETCIVRSDHTTTPLQALTLMNNITFVESARHLAERVLKVGDLTDRQRLVKAFRLVTSRAPSSDELAVLREDLQFYRSDFLKNPADAKQLLAIGETPNDPQLDPVQLAAYTLVANTILNLDEAISEN